ncbi:MAG: HlyD family secretion protein [Rhizobiaceae bacterium]
MSAFCWIPLAASLFSGCAEPGPLAVGYVEGDYVLVAPIEVAEVRTLDVRRGDRVDEGATLATLETVDARIAVDQAQATLSQAQAQLADLKEGRRPEEIAVLEASLTSARAQDAEAQRVLARQGDLLKRGIATQADYDQAKTQADVSAAMVGQAEANLAVARLPARPETIKAAEGQVKLADAALEQANWRLSKRTITAPAAGRIDDVIRNPGDLAGPAAPLISLLPDGSVKLRLYVPEPQFAGIAVGSELAISCDGCPEGLTARVSFVSASPEFTPPVIYSLETRQKLVYLVEARLTDDGRLQPGQIVDVRAGASRE